MPLTVGVGNIISQEGFSLLMSPTTAGSVWKTLLSQGAIPLGFNAWEKLRVIQGGNSLFVALSWLHGLFICSMQNIKFKHLLSPVVVKHFEHFCY